MDYWSGVMNWPVESDWKCETCNHSHLNEPILALFPALTWGLVHGVYRCNICHTEYSMRPGGEIVTRPVCLLKEEYKEPAKLGWKKFGKPISQWTDAMWDELMKGDHNET